MFSLQKMTNMTAEFECLQDYHAKDKFVLFVLDLKGTLESKGKNYRETGLTCQEHISEK